MHGRFSFAFLTSTIISIPMSMHSCSILLASVLHTCFPESHIVKAHSFLFSLLFKRSDHAPVAESTVVQSLHLRYNLPLFSTKKPPSNQGTTVLYVFSFPRGMSTLWILYYLSYQFIGFPQQLRQLAQWTVLAVEATFLESRGIQRTLQATPPQQASGRDPTRPQLRLEIASTN